MLNTPSILLAAKALATTAVAAAFIAVDCNPSLYYYDKWRMISDQFLRPNEQGDTVWIIGASSGIGQELACQLAAESSQISPKTLVLSSRNQSRLEKIAQEIQSTNPTCRVTVLPMDVTKNDDIESAVSALKHKGIILDTAVLNAGFGHLTPATETLPATAESVFRGNALWPMVLIPILNQDMFTSEPHFVVTASIASYIPVPLSATYCAAKYALLGYFRSLQAEEPHYCIQLISPGPVDTDFHQNHKQGQTTAPPPNKPASRLKMPVQRCARLTLRALQQRRSGEYWIAEQPLLSMLYINNVFPGLVRFIIGKVGPKRVDLWRRGLDLYDPKSWRK